MQESFFLVCCAQVARRADGRTLTPYFCAGCRSPGQVPHKLQAERVHTPARFGPEAEQGLAQPCSYEPRGPDHRGGSNQGL